MRLCLVNIRRTQGEDGLITVGAPKLPGRVYPYWDSELLRELNARRAHWTVGFKPNFHSDQTHDPNTIARVDSRKFAHRLSPGSHYALLSKYSQDVGQIQASRISRWQGEDRIRGSEQQRVIGLNDTELPRTPRDEGTSVSQHLKCNCQLGRRGAVGRVSSYNVNG